MANLPPREQQIIRVHSALIHRVVSACHDPNQTPGLEEILRASEANGWQALVSATRQILAGRRDPGLLEGLDEEDRVVVSAILRGLEDASTLPEPGMAGDPTAAAPGLAAMVHAAGRGDSGALQLIAGIAEQMSRVGGDMTRLAAIIRPLVNGERDPDILCKDMGPQGRSLVVSILDELGRLRPQ
ncbi:MAG: hypothetical protein QNJ87_00840 [Gammaproteobacteria bacterium]|nr:hypothetical protein [Gammaproteobacteria bacterium]MDJ0870295.1 hypothetical protein [Gammaproteobacteria bacterium]MDJ0889668.1 hypothetical protein [Gammaproteobacteria bacterium]